MSGILFALVSAFSNGVKSVIHRHVMKSESAYSYAMVGNILTALAFIPLLYKEFILPKGILPWGILTVAAILWTLVALSSFASYKFTHVSLREPISQSRLIFVFILSIIILSESIFIEKILGVLLIFIGIVILTYHKSKVFGRFSDKGVQLTLLSSLLISFVAIIDKKAVQYFTPGMYGFLVYLIPGIILLLFIKKRTKETKKLLKNKLIYIIIFMFLEMIAYYTYLKAFTLEEVSIVFPLTRLSGIVTVIGGLVLFREERKDVIKKIISTIIVILGAILISGKFNII